ncbi:MAG TPA: hypothetical protein VHR45_03645 [Thermoanaerobaculia bacterium]|nr:hypothetical protein [Thermoanaerobaculia bacterium]
MAPPPFRGAECGARGAQAGASRGRRRCVRAVALVCTWALARGLAPGPAGAAIPLDAPGGAPSPSPSPERPAVRVLRSGGLRVESAALLVSGQQGGDLQLATFALPLPGDLGGMASGMGSGGRSAAGSVGGSRGTGEGTGERARVAVVVEVAGGALQVGPPADRPTDRDSLLRLEVSFYAVDGAGGVQGSAAHTVEIDLRQLGARLRRGAGIRFAGELRLLPGEVSLRVLVRKLGSRLVGLQVSPLLVPAGEAREPILLPPLLAPLAPLAPTTASAGHDDAWIEVRAPGVSDPLGGWRSAFGIRAAGAAGALPGAASEAGAEAGAADTATAGSIGSALLASGALPAARPVLGAEREAWLMLAARGLPEQGLELGIEVRRVAAAAVATATATVAAIGQIGQLAESAAVALLPGRALERRRVPGASGFELIGMAVSCRGLAPGLYVLRVVARAPGLRAASPPLPFVVAAPDSPEGGWPQLVGAASAPQATQPPKRRLARGAAESRAPWVGRRLRGAAPALTSAYRAALARLAAGEEEAARVALADLELGALRDHGASVEDLAAIEVRALQQLAESDPEALVPVVHLYQLLYRDAHERRRPQLATHAREMTRSVADFYAARSRSALAHQLAAALLVQFGGELEAAGGPANGFSRRAFARAVELDGANPAALLCLAIDAERHGNLSGALPPLERLHADHPDDPEPGLRLGLVLARLGRQAEARRLLKAVAAGPLPEGPAEKDPTAWWQTIALQELGRLLLDSADLEAAEKVLRDGLRRFPGNEKLTLELAMVLDQRQQPDGAQEVVSAWRSAGGIGSGERHRYTELPAALLEKTASDLRPLIAERLPALAATLRLVQEKGK